MNLEEVAQLAGVSRSTVSRVVNDDPRVSPPVRLRVQNVIREHEYHPNAAARSLASKRTRLLGLLVPQSTAAIFSDPYFPLLIQGAVAACNAADHNLLLLMENTSDPLAAGQLYSRVIRGRHLDGVVIASSVVDDPVVSKLLRGDFPYVLVGRHPRHEDVSFVDVDNREAAQQGVAHLLEHGYRRIALIGGMRNMIASIDRHAGYVTALQQAGLLPDPALVVDGGFSETGGYEAMRGLLAHKPDAVFAASDTMALGAIRMIQEAGLRVPDDLAVLGFDGLELGAISQPPLSTVAQPIGELGREAIRTLLDRVAHPAGPAIHRRLDTQLILRRTCGCPLGSALEKRGGDRPATAA